MNGMKEKRIGVSKVVIQMGDKEATLTVEQAKELRDSLNALLGETKIERVIERDVFYPHRWIYTTPSWTTYGTMTTTGDTGNYTIAMNSGDALPV